MLRKKIIILSLLIIFIIPKNTKAVITEFQKYNLTDGQINAIANVCIHEQGTPEGAAAEASLIANRFELKGKNNGSGMDLVNYVRNSGWFAGSVERIDSGYTIDPGTTIKNVIRSVLVDGKRTLPGYIDEHDYIGDIGYVENYGVSFPKEARDQYIPHVTIVHQDSSRIPGAGSWIYYTHPTPTSDPFGYTSEANRMQIGEFHYDFNGNSIGTGNTNNGIGGLLGGALVDNFEFPSLFTSDEFTCKNLFYYQTEKGETKQTAIKKLLDGIFWLMKIAAPILAISLTILDYIRVITNNDDSSLRKANKRTIIRIAVAITIFLLPYLLEILFNLFGLYNLNCTIG